MATLTLYNKFKKREITEPIDWDTNSFTLLLLKPAHTPSTGDAGHEFIADVDANEVTGTNYARKPLTITVGGPTSGVVAIDASNDPSYAQDAGGFSDARYGIVAKDTGNDATSALVGIVDFGVSVGNVAGPLTVQVNGIIDRS
jgi:hypothetical protein